MENCPTGRVLTTDLLLRAQGRQVEVGKIRSLARRYLKTHFAVSKWDTYLEPYIAIICKALEGKGRLAPFDLLCFPEDSAERFIDDEGYIQITHADLE